MYLIELATFKLSTYLVSKTSDLEVNTQEALCLKRLIKDGNLMAANGETSGQNRCTDYDKKLL